MSKANNINYQKISDAKVENGILTVQFADGDIVTIPVSQLLPGETQLALPPAFDLNDFEININTSDGQYAIPWDRIRILTDDEFAKEMVAAAEENSKSVGRRIKTLRERQNLTAKKLAERAGIAAQTITRIEKGQTDLSFGILKRILTAMGYSLSDLATEELNGEFEIKPLTYLDLLKKINGVGVDQQLVRRILPSPIIERAASIKGHIPELLRHEIALYLGKIFNWTEDAIWADRPLEMSFSPAQHAYFKTPSVGNVRQIKAYCHYAFYVAEVITRINTRETIRQYPGDIEEFKTTFYSNYADFTFENLLDYAWDMGIAVIPLSDSGVFHGASWNIKGKHAIVLKQKVQSHARWIYDLLHELYHVFVHLETPDTSVVEWEDLNPYAGHLQQEELEANAFADQFIFGTHVDEYLKEVLDTSNFKMELLKRALAQVAEREELRSDFLANYMAFRLQASGKNWWGTANSFQITDPSPALIASNKLKERVSLQNLNPIDHNIITAAVNL